MNRGLWPPSDSWAEFKLEPKGVPAVGDWDVSLMGIGQAVLTAPRPSRIAQSEELMAVVHYPLVSGLHGLEGVAAWADHVDVVRPGQNLAIEALTGRWPSSVLALERNRCNQGNIELNGGHGHRLIPA